MTGYVDYADVPAIYRQADIFVSPTYAEGFSNTILEAMASGLAVVSCRSVGVVDCIRDGENGLLTEPGDVPALTAALRRVLTDPAERARLAAAGLEECRRVYSWQAVGRQIMDVYAALAGSAPDRDWPLDLPRTPCRFRPNRICCRPCRPRCSSRRIWTTSCSPAAAWPRCWRIAAGGPCWRRCSPARWCPHRVRPGLPA